MDQHKGPKVVPIRRLRSLGEFEERHRLPELDWKKVKEGRLFPDRRRTEPEGRSGQPGRESKPSRYLRQVLKLWKAGRP